MWQRLKLTDIAQARRELDRRRAEVLSRQAAELGVLDAEWADVEKLFVLAQSFSRKYVKSRFPAPSEAPAPETSDLELETLEPEIPAITTSRISPPPWRNADGDYPRTNFDVFSRAIAKATF